MRTDMDQTMRSDNIHIDENGEDEEAEAEVEQKPNENIKTETNSIQID